MTDTVLASRRHTPSRGRLAERAGALGLVVCALFREWYRRSRSRYELASYSHEQRADLGYAAELDAEIDKPFWRQ